MVGKRLIVVTMVHEEGDEIFKFWHRFIQPLFALILVTTFFCRKTDNKLLGFFPKYLNLELFCKIAVFFNYFMKLPFFRKNL